MAAKVKELARLMLMSRKTVAYTGAGGQVDELDGADGLHGLD